MKNIGFMYVKQTYPTQYKNMTFIFNDIDTLPYRKNLLEYVTVKGKVKHFFGFNFALGGIFSIKGSDFEKIDGFPNYWQWGFEDNVIYKRVIENNITVDRSNFYKIGSHQILHFCDAICKTLDKDVLSTQFDRKYKEKDGLSKLKNVKYNTDEENMVDVSHFESYYSHINKNLVDYPVTNGSTIQNPNKVNKKKTLLFL
tara:strand:- start:3077 stop:3673 length:597 start_codon:yes stop_codon:yes gene_type:complete